MVHHVCCTPSQGKHIGRMVWHTVCCNSVMCDARRWTLITVINAKRHDLLCDSVFARVLAHAREGHFAVEVTHAESDATCAYNSLS